MNLSLTYENSVIESIVRISNRVLVAVKHKHTSIRNNSTMTDEHCSTSRPLSIEFGTNCPACELSLKFRYIAKRKSSIMAMARESTVTLCAQLGLALHWVPKSAVGMTRDADAIDSIDDAVNAKVVLKIDSSCLIPPTTKQHPVTLIGQLYLIIKEKQDSYK